MKERDMELRVGFVMVAIACSLVRARGQERNTLRLVQRIALPNVQGNLNHMSVDAARQRLFVPAPSDGKLEIVDLASGKPWRSLNSERPAAARFAAELNQLYVSSGRNLYFYDTTNFGLTARLDLGGRLDEIAYDATVKRLYVGCMTDAETGIAVIALPEGKLLERIPLPDSPQGILAEESGTRIFANVPDRNYVAVVNRYSLKIMEQWGLKGGSDNFPMALDEPDHQLLVACRTPAELFVLDTRSGKVIAHLPCVGDADDLWYDATRKRVYVSGGEGTISVIEQEPTGRFRLLGTVATAPDAATSIFSDQLDALYVAVPRRASKPAEILVFKPAGKS